jgi:phage terminase large subunit
VRVEIPNNFDPRDYQIPFMQHFIGNGHDGRGKSAVEVDHRRAGKDLMGMHMLNVCAHRRRGAYWHTFPTFEQGRKAIWEGFTKAGERTIDNVFPEPLIRRRDNQSMVIELKCGSIYRIIGTDKIEAVGAGPVGVLHSEYSIAKPKAADLIAPMLRENDGWEAYVYTPRGNNHGKKLYDRMKAAAAKDPARYFCALHTLYDTRAYDPDLTLAEERAKGRPEALIRQEYLCDWAAADVGSVYGELMEVLAKAGAVGVEYEPEAPRVFSSWDLGGAGAKGDATCFWLWSPTADGVDVLDYYENRGKPLSHYLDEVERRAKAIGVRVLKHWLPHDATGMHLTGTSVLEQSIERLGASMVSLCPRRGLLDGIQAVRWLLQRKTRFHARCAEGVEALKAYHYEWDDERKTLANTPEHDWSSHGADGFRYTAVVIQFSDQMTKPPLPAESAIARAIKQPTIDELWESQPRASERI